MHHLGIGADHRGKRVILIADDTTVTVVHLTTGEILATNTIDPEKTYWRNTQKARPMARSFLKVTYVATQVRPMSRLITWWT